MTRVLVTGGSGFLGINLIPILVEEGFDVRSIDLEPLPDAMKQENVESRIADVRDPEAMRRAMEGMDQVIHCAAALPLYPRDDIFSTEIEGTRTVLSAALEAGVDRVIHISSTAVYGVPEHHPVLETDPLKGIGPYGEAKVIAEAVCEEYRQKGLAVCIIRPKTFVGPERLGVFALLYDWAADARNFPILGRGNNRYQLLAVEDLCHALWLCTILPRDRVNDTFNLGAKEFGTMREDFQAVLDEAGFKRMVIGLPALPAIKALKMLESLGLSPLYQWIYDTASHDSIVSIEKAEKILGFAPKFSNRDTLIRNFQWFLEHRNQFGDSTGIRHRTPWNQGALNVAKFFF